MDRIQAITFDYWGTLYQGLSARPLRMQRLVQVLGAHGYEFDEPALDEADRVAWQAWERVWRHEYRTLGSPEWLGLMLGHLNVTLPQPELDALADYFNSCIVESDPPIQLIDGVSDAVRRLSRRYRLGVISDTGLSTGRVLRHFLERDGVLDRFACLSFSDELGVSKPHPDAFRRTLACLNAQPERAVHIGDLTRTDIAGAKAISMRAVRFTGVNDDPDRSAAPDATVSTFADFELLIEAWDADGSED
jgi:putative hydrolase of the HAD superfamily